MCRMDGGLYVHSVQRQGTEYGRHTCCTQIQHQITSTRNRGIIDQAISTRSLFREPQTLFSVCQPEVSPLWLASLLLLCGDIESNPGPTKPKLNSTHTKQIWTCSICTKTITHNQTSFLCHDTDHWVHKKCANITERNHHDTWTCPIHSHSQSNTNINQPTLNQQPSTLTSSNINQQFTTGQPTTSTQVTYHSKVKELENKRCKTSTKSKSDSTHTKQIWTCLICTKTITHNQTSFLCHDTDHWVHKKCANTTERNLHATWTCQLHSHNQNNMASNQSNLNQQPSTLTSSSISQQFTTGQPTTVLQHKLNITPKSKK